MPVSQILQASLASGVPSATNITTGTLPSAQLPSGTVLQVVSAIKTDTFTTTSGTFIDLPGMSVNITPRSASSRFFIIATISGAPAVSGCFLNGGLVRNSTLIGLGNSGDSGQTLTMSQVGYTQDSGAMLSMSMSILDAPATTSQITYKVQVNTSNHPTNPIFINRSQQDSGSTRARASSSITVMEIA